MDEIRETNVKNLWKLSYPMMVSFFSMMLMIFVDRIFLSWRSTESLNAGTQAGTLSWGIILGWLTMGAMSEVLVSQLNGAKKYKSIGTPVWQMIWFCFASFLFFIPMAIWGAKIIYNPLLQTEAFLFLRTLLFFGPITALVPAIGGFYVGIGKTQILQWMAITGNIVNIILDYILIFGVEGLIQPLGIVGAGIATGIGSLIQCVILFICFINKNNRTKYGTASIGFNYEIFKKTFKIGLPPSIFISLEFIGWAVFYHIMASISQLHIFVASICQSIFLLFLFFGCGLEKGVISMSGNLIGANLHDKISEVVLSGIKLLTLYSIFAAIFLVIYPNPLIDWFISNKEISNIGTYQEIKHSIRIGLIFSFFLLIFENIRWIFSGILTSVGDTVFLLLSGTFNVWFILIIPTYLFTFKIKSDILYSFFIWIIYGLISTIVIYLRFTQGKWKKHLLSVDNKQIINHNS